MLSLELFKIAWNAQCKANCETLPDEERRHGATTAIILSAASAEGFINEVGELCANYAGITDHIRALLDRIATLDPKSLTKFDKEVQKDLKAASFLNSLSTALHEVEESKGSVRLKYHVASQILAQKTFDKDAQPFQDFATLIRLRDEHMHLKARAPEKMVKDLDTGKHRLEPSGYLKDLVAKGLASGDPERIRWLQRVQTPNMAQWACRVSITMMLAVLDLMPRQTHKMYCVVDLIEKNFRPQFGPSKPWDAIFENQSLPKLAV